MHRVLISAVVLGLLAGGARAGILLGTSNPPGTPLSMTAGTTSGSMFVNVVGSGTPNDMADWQFRLVIIPDAGTTGTLTFKDPGLGSTSPPNPTNYVFDGHGVGIAAVNGSGGTQLDANDFDNNNGTVVPGAPGANLLLVDFLASSNASGLFGIYAVRGSAFTLWDDGSGSVTNPQFFTNVPSGSGTVRIGDVRVSQGTVKVPEPSSLVLLGIGTVALVGYRWRRNPAA